MDTIFALSTPPGKSGIAVIRVSGMQAAATLEALGVTPLPAPRRAMLAELRAAGVMIDKALVLFFPAPHSFTGEDSVEYHVHGSRAVIRRLLETFSALPSLRPAEAGEFARRAFLNGKMDLTAAEGLADLIDAETEAQRRQALRFMRGEGAAFYGDLRERMLEALALMEAYIDFPDEEIPPQALEHSAAQAQEIMAAIESQLADGGVSERIRDGVRVAILGPPNTGKSSLMNLLAARDVAIVSEIAGTTRDVIEVHLDIGGYAVVIADTAGLRETGDRIEREGIARSLARAEAADLRIIVLDAGEPESWREAELLLQENTLLLLNKTDQAMPSPLPVIGGHTPLPVSALRRTGIEALLAALAERVAALAGGESSFIARSRHRHHLTQALGHLRSYAAHAHAGLELRCEELRRAAVEIGKITGSISVDEVLGQIFSRFCIGK